MLEILLNLNVLIRANAMRILTVCSNVRRSHGTPMRLTVTYLLITPLVSSHIYYRLIRR